MATHEHVRAGVVGIVEVGKADADQASRDVVDRIGKVPTARGDRPVDDVVIESVEVQRS